ncbi:MAG: HEAT repeat domain-containing protein, partial [Nitrospirae bacterium]
MVEDKEKIPLDTRLLTNAIIELNISRRNVSLYPKGHPAVNQSIKKAFDYLNQIFEIRPFITVAFAKDTIVVDEHALEKKNPVFREFALSISRLNVAYITFKKGLTDEELYNFNKLVTSSRDIFCNEKTQELLGKQGIHHIEVGCIDYDSFSFKETTEEQQAEENLWERYVYGLLKGTLGGNEAFEVVSELSPEELAQMINEVPDEELDENSYDRVITTYLKSASDTPFSTEDMQRLLNMINSLRPELRRQFLSSTVRCLDKDRERLKRAVKDISVDTIINMLDAFNKEQLTIPETLKTILEKFSSLNLDLDMLKPVESEDSLMLDDILLSEDMKRVFQEGNYSEFVSEEYKREIESLVKTKGKPLKGKQIEELTKEFSEPAIYKSLCGVMLELSGSSGVEEENLKKYIERLKQQGTILLETGQYDELANIITTLETLKRENPERTELSEALDYFYSTDFIEALMESLRLIGRLFREGAFKLVDCYGNRIIPHLLDALIKEETSSSRKFLIALILYFGREGVEEAVKLLGDSRWFVKRNMLYILSEAGYEESLPYVKPYCRHENSKVRLEAIKCLLKFNDPYGIEALKELFSSDDHEIVHQAIVLSGTYRVKEVVPELLSLLRKKGISGYDILSKSPVIKSLGQIGDPRAIAGFKDIMKLKSVLFKSAVDSIKEEVVRT